MGNIIRWSLPDLTEVTYTKAYIYRANSKSGVYEGIQVQDITDNTYFDEAGSNNHWYKIAFRIGTTGTFSELSDPIRGGKFNGYCSIYDVRNFSSSLPSTKISDTILYEFIKFANAQINQDIMVEYINERIEYISADKKNLVNGSNKTFYVKNPYLGDGNNDGIIDETEIYCYGYNQIGERTIYAVEEMIDVRFGEFRLSIAPPTGTRLFITYKSCPVLLYPNVNYMVRLAAVNYVLALAYSRTDPGQVKSFRVNKVSITGEMSPAKKYITEYNNLVSKIVSTPIKERTSVSQINNNIGMVI
jgi:hypothetical protein